MLIIVKFYYIFEIVYIIQWNTDLFFYLSIEFVVSVFPLSLISYYMWFL